jgi:DHA1 family bicyclomycin/chloramphenicol resistance-like MFS transporter
LPYRDAVSERAPERGQVSVVSFLAFVSVLMAFGVDAALPAFDELRSEFSFDARGLSPAITGTCYFVGMAVGQLFYGALGDRFGRRPVMLLGIAIYAFGALGSATAPGLEVLLVARFVWGFGAAAPTVLRLAIARDLYSGDRMARVVTLVTAVFLIGPIVVPLLAEGILLFGTWRTVFATSLVLAAVAFVWTVHFGETLAPERRRALRLGTLRDAFVAIAHTRVTLWAIVAQTFFSAAFFVWLGSAQPVIDRVYGRDSQFTLFFGLSGVGMAVALVANNHLIGRFGVRRMATRAATVFVVVGLVGSVLAVALDGVPSIWLWLTWAIVANSMSVIIAPMCAAIALEPMADRAATASAILGLAQLGAGACLAALVDALIEETVTPMIFGATVFGLIGLSALLWSGRVPASAGAAERNGTTAPI